MGAPDYTPRCCFGSQSPAPIRNTFTKKEAISSQYASVRVDATRAAVERATQYRRRYLDVDESEIAPRET